MIDPQVRFCCRVRKLRTVSVVQVKYREEMIHRYLGM